MIYILEGIYEQIGVRRRIPNILVGSCFDLQRTAPQFAGTKKNIEEARQLGDVIPKTRTKLGESVHEERLGVTGDLGLKSDAFQRMPSKNSSSILTRIRICSG